MNSNESLVVEAKKIVTACSSIKAEKSTVNHPEYYKTGGLEAIDVIEAWGLGFCLGNAVKYISRAGKKNPDKEIEDLEKAAWYLNREINNRKNKLNSEKSEELRQKLISEEIQN